MSETNLKDIEIEISGCVKLDKRNWTRIYRLMNEVDENQLYKQREDTPTFTSWVNALSEELGVHVSLLWARRKAGKNYAEYVQRAEEQGREVKALEDLSVSPDSINLCAKVAGKNAVEMDRLIDRVIEGDLTRDDLRAAAKAKRAAADAKGAQVMAKNKYDRIEAEDRTEIDDRITAADIVMALRKSDWLTTVNDNKYFTHVYHCFPEFRMDSGTSRYSRRVDALIAETVTAVERDEVVLRGIEIKVDRNDLKQDQKMAEYTDFCDFFYVAVPDDNEDLINDVKSMIRPKWGILTINREGKICVDREPERLNSIFRDKALATCVIKLMSDRWNQ